ncbi:hypothetical protein [Rhizobium sp. No.120]
MAFVIFDGFPIGIAGKRRSRLKKEIGWSGLGSVSIRCFGDKDALLPAGVMPLWDKEVCRFRAVGEIEFDL